MSTYGAALCARRRPADPPPMKPIMPRQLSSGKVRMGAMEAAHSLSSACRTAPLLTCQRQLGTSTRTTGIWQQPLHGWCCRTAALNTLYLGMTSSQALYMRRMPRIVPSATEQLGETLLL